MKIDRAVDIPIRHRFVDYVCMIDYSQYEKAFNLITARFADPRRTEKPKNGMDLYLRILKEPALRANLLEALVPDSKGQINDLREKAISERGKNYGFTAGIVVFCFAGYALYKLTSLVAKYVGQDWAEIITYIPAFFAFLVVFPVQHAVERWYARRYCSHHSHRFETFKSNQGKEVTWCKRCGLNISGSSHASEV